MDACCCRGNWLWLRWELKRISDDEVMRERAKWLANQATIKGLSVQVIARIMKVSDEEVQSIIIC